ncbi:hypothetical protein AB0D11_41455 [Streptomyces monashensis]|uniref:hypothetical protein n=1 Tax=Streptomyces monashensis TaxID=1678012 RepID=UPI0033CFBA47
MTWVKYTDTGRESWEHDGSQHRALWVKVVDGWSKDGNWGSYLQITCRTQKDKHIDSSDGWVKPVSSKGDKLPFYDMGTYYEIWQNDRETGRPPHRPERLPPLRRWSVPRHMEPQGLLTPTAQRCCCGRANADERAGRGPHPALVAIHLVSAVETARHTAPQKVAS